MEKTVQGLPLIDDVWRRAEKTGFAAERELLTHRI